MSLKSKEAFFWSALGRAIYMLVSFFSSILIARMLTPKEYGTISLVLVLVQIANVFIDSGFTNSLIQKKDSNQTDFSTIFFFNFFCAVLFCCILWFGSSFIARFYKNEQLIIVARILGVNLVLGALAGVPKALLSIRLDFKRLSIASILSVIGGATIGIYLAYAGHGIYSLLLQTLTLNLVYLIVVFTFAKWKPLIVFSIKSLRQLGSFSCNLLLSNLVATIYTNLNELLIGRVYSTNDVGIYSRGKSVAVLPSLHISGIIDQVTFPILCKLQDLPQKLIQSYFRYMRYSLWITTFLSVILIALADPIVLLLLTDKWISIVPVVRILSLAYIFYPIRQQTSLLLNALGRSDANLKQEIWKKIIGLGLLLLCLPYGIYSICLGFLLSCVVDVLISIWFVRKVVSVGFKEHLVQIFPVVGIMLLVGGSTYLCSYFPFNPIIIIGIGCLWGSILFICMSILFKQSDIIDLFRIILKYFNLRLGS